VRYAIDGITGPLGALVHGAPASETATASPTASDDVEVGGLRGRQALERLRNVIGRVESSWRPASAEESFEKAAELDLVRDDHPQAVAGA